MKYSRKHLIKKNRNTSKKIKKNTKKKRHYRRQSQKGGFIGTMFNIATLPFKLVANPLMNKLSNMMSNNSSISNGNSGNSNSNSGNNNSSLNDAAMHSIRMNNSNINTLKQLSMYGYNNATLNSYIQQLHHINV